MTCRGSDNTIASLSVKNPKQSVCADDDRGMNIRLRAAIVTAAAFSYLAFSLPASAETTGYAEPHAVTGVSQLAPADEYFGPLRLSVLGLHNHIVDTASRVERGDADTGGTMKHLALLEASVRDLEGKYPADSWLPRMVLDLHRVYRRIGTEEASLRSIDVASWLLHNYRNSSEAQTLRGELAEAMQNEFAPGTPEDDAVAVPVAIADDDPS